MKAAVRAAYGSPEVVEIREIEKPVPADDEVLVRVRAASVNPADWYSMTGMIGVRAMGEGLIKPKNIRLGTDFAGTVEAVGANVAKFEPGDDVFGGRTGALADYVIVKEDRAIALKPPNVSFEEAAGVPIAGITALQGLRDKANIQPGQNILINGASGGVGTFSVQIAKMLGADVTAVCSTRNVDIARSLGADRVIDYTREDFTRDDGRYDVLFDIAGSRTWRDSRRVLKPEGLFVMVGAPKTHPLRRLATILIAGKTSRKPKVVFFVAKLTSAEMNVMRELLEGGKVKTVVDKRYELKDAAEAFRYLGNGHTQGKVVVTTGAL